MVNLFKTMKLTKSKLKEMVKEVMNEAQQEIGGYYMMKQLKDLAHDAKRSGEKKVAKALMFLHDRINQSSRDIDLNADDLNDFLKDPRGRKYAKDLPDWMIDSLFESDLPTTTKKDKTVTVVHKTSGKELVITDTPSTRKKYKRMGYFVQADPRKIKKAIRIAKTMGGNMTGAVKKIERIEKDLSNNHDVVYALKTANESINEAGMFDDYHELNLAYMDKFIKNYKKLNSKNLVKKKGGDVYGFRKGEREAHWKFDDDYKLHYDINKAKVLGLINFYNRAKKNHPWG